MLQVTSCSLQEIIAMSISNYLAQIINGCFHTLCRFYDLISCCLIDVDYSSSCLNHSWMDAIMEQMLHAVFHLRKVVTFVQCSLAGRLLNQYYTKRLKLLVDWASFSASQRYVPARNG